MVGVILLSFCADIISTLPVTSDWMFPFIASGNYLEIFLNTLLISIYFQYVCTQVSNIDVLIKRRVSTILWIMVSVCWAIVISTLFTKEIFYYDEAKMYHRGPLFWVPMSLLFVMMVVVEEYIISQKRKIERNHYKSLVLFLTFPIIGWALQFFVYGLPFSLISLTFAAQVVFANIQNRNMDTDYLTGLFNRQSLDRRMQERISAASEKHSFSAILLDIDDFKKINDSFGHYEGDMALIHTAELLRNSTGHGELIARYGGDEFCILTEEDDPALLEEMGNRIRSNLITFNQNRKQPYEISFSMGYAVYKTSYGKNTEDFIKVIDKKMYEEKKFHKQEF